jgi:FkbM family methyltransferase
VSPDASLRYWTTPLEKSDPLLLGLCAELVHPGDRVWDVGANVGLFSFAAAFLAGSAGEVLAIEPDPWLAALLGRSADELPVHQARVKVLQIAIAADDGSGQFAIAGRGRAANHLTGIAGSSQAGGSRETLPITTRSLDSLLVTHGPPRVVKIDVEGAEHLCLEGATTLLETVRPVVLCEVSAENAATVNSLLKRSGYRVFDAAVPVAERQPLESPAWNTLALPA